MKKPEPRRSLYLLAIVAPLFLFLFENACSFRISDREAREEFSKSRVSARIGDMKYGRRFHIHYIQTGLDSAATLFFVHGSPGSWDAFMHYMMDSTLRSKFRIISVDRPGFGHSNFGRAINLASEARVLEQLMDTLQNGKPYNLIGHSLGGPLVALMAADRPNDVASTVILSGALDPSLEPKEHWRYVMNLIPLRYLLPGAFRPSNKELIYLKKDLVKLKTRLPDVTCDIYILHGNKDVLVDVGNVAYMDSMFTHAAVVHDTIFDGENHFIPWTRYKEIKSVLLKLPEDKRVDVSYSGAK